MTQASQRVTQASQRVTQASRRVVVRPVTPARLADVATLFGTSKTTTGCYGMWFVVSSRECTAGWSGGNHQRFDAMTRASGPPLGLLAYHGREAVGWAAAGPRSRYARALKSSVFKQRQPLEDDAVWLLPCFYIRRDARRSGLTLELIDGAVELARRHGATAIEGFPLAGHGRRGTGEAFVGVEPQFAACGFAPVARPTPARVV